MGRLKRSEGKYHNSGIEDITLLSIPHLEIYLTQKRGERKLRVNEVITILKSMRTRDTK